MIYDHVDNLSLYLPQDTTKKIQAFLSEVPSENKKFHLDGDHLMAITSRYTPREFEDGLYESHFKYIDLQIMIEGSELIFYHPTTELVKEKEDRSNDIVFYKKTNHGVSLPINNHMFMLLNPWDGHLPSVNDKKSSNLRKVVFKIKS